MKVLVNEIEKKELIKVFPYFVSGDEITILEDASLQYETHNCKSPYYIDENIRDLDQVIKLCMDVSYARTPIRNKVNWNNFVLFWALMLSIYKQRKVGKKVSDLEYLYNKFKDKYDITLTNTLKLGLGFTNDEDVIIGKSDIGIMFLYKNDEYFDFVFEVEYTKKGKKKHTHWHPQDFFEASYHLDMFMSNVDLYGLKSRRHLWK